VYRDFKSQIPGASGLQPRSDPKSLLPFGYIKGKLSDYTCESREDLLNEITEILTGIGQEVLNFVCDDWNDSAIECNIVSEKLVWI
jgi:hypothetical protein